MNRNAQYYYALDGVRFAAALSVCLFHLSFYSWASQGSTTSEMFAHAGAFPRLTPFTWVGWMGVEVFFVLSGLVIANSANGASPIAFLKSRVLRLLPAAWICATLTLVAVLTIARSPLQEVEGPYLRAIILWPGGPWIDGVYWSLGVEVVFYAIIFAMLSFHKFRRLPALAWTLLTVSGSFLVVSWMQALGVISNGRVLDFVTAHSESLLLRDGVIFAVGIWLWMSTHKLMTPARWIGLVAAVALGGLEIWLRAHALETVEAPASRGQPIGDLLVAWVAFVGVIFAATRWPKTFTPSSPSVRNGLKSLGRATYPLYLVHNVLGVGIARELLLHGVPRYVALASALTSVMLLSLFIAAVPEAALRRALRWLFEKIEPSLPKGGLALRSEPI